MSEEDETCKMGGAEKMRNTNRYNMKRLDKNLTSTGICYSVCTGIRLMAFVGFDMYNFNGEVLAMHYQYLMLQQPPSQPSP